jgi:N-acylneuraminate cytidylyltransferase
MIQGKSVLALIPARGGSKGVPRKNVRLAGGKPLIAWTIEAAKRSRYVDRVVLSSDDAEIIETAKKWGCEVPFKRSPELATDQASSASVVVDALERVPGFDYVVLLQPTSPLRTGADIDACLEKCLKDNADSCVSVTEAEQSPYWMYALDARGRMKPLLNGSETADRRQDLPKVLALNGAVYVARSDWFREKRGFVAENTVCVVMPAERSLDIDTEMDMKYLELWYQEAQNAKNQAP